MPTPGKPPRGFFAAGSTGRCPGSSAVRTAFALCALALAPTAACAAEYPSKPIRIIVPFPPGGTTDVLARLLGPKLTESLKQSVVVDNRSGASGLIGGEAIARAPADGHTVGIIISLHAIAPALYAKAPFDPARDFAPVTLVISVPNAISVHPSLPVASIPALVNLAKAQPGKLSFAHAGTGTGVHLTGELFKSVAKLDIVHVPYKGGGPALADVMAGQVPMGVQNVSTIVPHVRAGRLRPLGVTSLERSAALPEVRPSPRRAIPASKPRNGMAWWHPAARRARSSAG